MAITIFDVARAAGVSSATVSHALNNRGHVNPFTRRRIISIAEKLGYIPNSHARKLASNHIRMLGAIVSDIDSPFFPEVIKAFAARTRELEYEFIFSDTNYEPLTTERAILRMLEQKVQGIALFTSGEVDFSHRSGLLRRVPKAVLLNGVVRENVSNLKIDYHSGINQIVRHLYDLGHRRIIFAGGRRLLKTNVGRRKAYADTMHALGLKPNVPILTGNARFEGGVGAATTILGMSPMPTAVLAINDATAAGLIKGFHQNGLRVPEDISVTGFDHTRMAEYIVPSLTTVDLPREVLGRIAADALHELCSSPGAQGREYCISTKMVVGESSGPVPAAKRVSVQVKVGTDESAPVEKRRARDG